MILKFTVGEFEKILIMSLKLRRIPTCLLISTQQMFFFKMMYFEEILIMSLKLRRLPTLLIISTQHMFFFKMIYFEDVKEANRLVLSDSESG